MGSQIQDPEELTVLVTGYGPFREQYPVNPSWEIARDLPAYLPPLRAKDAKARSGIELPSVRILVHPEPLRVSYKAVRDIVPSFWDTYQGRKVDIAVHIGMAGPRRFYSIERRGHRDGYRVPDVDGETLDEVEEGNPDGDWIWEGAPEELLTDLDLDDILLRWQGYSVEASDLRISEDAGHYLCDFILYSSLAHLWKQGRPRKVVFLHVPADASQETVASGRDLAINLIRSIAESEVTARQKQKQEQKQKQKETQTQTQTQTQE